MPKAELQKHKILRQVIEVDGCTTGNEQHVRSLMRSTYYKKLLASIDRVCSELSAPDRIHRIDRLEIDLGKLSIDALGPDFVKSFERAFRKKLGPAIRHTPEVDTDLELFDFFIHTGSLPWWADNNNSELLTNNLETLIQKKPAVMRQMLRRTTASKQLWRRIARAYPDALLDKLANLLAPGIWSGDGSAKPAVGLSWLILLQEASVVQGRSTIINRNLFWEQALRAASGHRHASAPDVYKRILQQIAKSIQYDYLALINAVQQTLKNKTITASLNAWVREIIDLLAQELNTESDQKPQPSESVETDTETDAIDLLGQELDTESDQKPQPSESVETDTETDALRTDLTKLLTRLEQSLDPDGSLINELRAWIERLPTSLKKQALIRLDKFKDPAHQSPQDNLKGLVRSILDQLFETDTGLPVDPVRSDFSKADALYIGNAGLVLLWPFLTHFFQRLDLLKEDAEGTQRPFNDEAAQHRAVGLLQYLASADESPRETLLPLNKILCGMTVDAVFDFGPEISAEEKKECDQLLTAVIQRAPILKDMSHAGLRSSFLLRQGQLSVLDERWLLRVERETHDIVLDRFPWGFNIVKLPWMETLLQVEW